MDTVYLNTIQKDIVKRFNISDTGKLDAVVRFLFDNVGCETSARGIERGLKAAGHIAFQRDIGTLREHGFSNP